MANDLIATIRARQSAVAAKVAKLRPQLETLERELREYETALKVLEQVADSGATAISNAPTTARLDGEPTMPDLILKALANGPMPVSDVTDAVSKLSGKQIDPNNIRSTTWRLWKANRIEKTGDNYHLIGQAPEKDEADFEDFL